MSEITKRSEPRPSLLWAIYLTGIVLMLAAAKGHIWWWAGELGQWLMIGTVGAFALRAWDLWRK